MNIEKQLYNLKMKVLTLDELPEHLKETLANDIHLIEASIRIHTKEQAKKLHGILHHVINY